MRIFKKVPKKDMLQFATFVYPTETSYGVGCDATNQQLVERIYEIKGRDFKKPVSWIVADIKMAERYVEFSACAFELAKKFWPGPLTLVLPLKNTPSVFPLSQMGGEGGTIALRVSPHPIAMEIVKTLQRPIVATSANISSYSECYTICEVIGQFKRQQLQPDIIIDGGILPKRPPTTVVEIVDDEVCVLRQGELNLNIKTAL